jgi:hypothetical protein
MYYESYRVKTLPCLLCLCACVESVDDDVKLIGTGGSCGQEWECSSWRQASVYMLCVIDYTLRHMLLLLQPLQED